ncbi:hypothetical protein K435DRAFT_192114 [Dendrothele bispora CBS 962.96]|uniref:Autophagy-related protein 13 n=1 Tax=Dendrothele bispora (strain CBS 962.96) TaxID=1314807 RepID=A0A4S8LWC2_DENBC|nr:hypothetical protein K435DRAFT_192114 [Dendrothele bispora CBS 962.96]
MSNDTQRADQIAFHFYTKLFYVLNHARATAEPGPNAKVDKWFILETPHSDLFPRESRDRYKSISTSLSASASNSSSSLSSPSSSFSSSTGVPPLEIQVLLTIPDLNTNQVLVYLPDSSSSTSTRNRVQPTPKHVLLEKWVLEFTPRNATHRTRDRDRDGREGAEEASGPAGSSVALSTIYKHGIPLFRSLFSLLRILPAWKVAKRLKRRGLGGGPANGMSVMLRVADPTSAGGPGQQDILGFGPSSSQSDASHYQTQVSQTLTLPTSTHAFPPVPHPLGTLTLTSTYLSNPNFD